MLRTALCLTVVLAASRVAAEDWPQFRGPKGDGHYQGPALPSEWGPDKNVVWKQAIPGKGWSSPVTWKGNIYLTTAVEKDGKYSLQALAVAAKDGKLLWQTEVFLEDGAKSPRPHGKNSRASPTPVVDGERLYVHFGHMGTAALDLDGKVLWRNDTLKYRPVHGNGGSPILVDDKLVFSGDGSDVQFVVALDKKTGEVVWKTPRKTDAFKKFSFSTPHLITVDDKLQIVSSGSDLVAGYDPATGKELWRVAYEGYSLIQRPVYGHGLVFLSCGFDEPVLYAVKPGKGDVTKTNIVWTNKRAVSLTPSFLLAGDELYMVSDKGIATCMDAKKGTVHWSERVPGAYSASPIYHDGKIWLTNEEGVGVVLHAGKEFKILARNDLEESTFASFAPVDGALFVRTEKRLYRFEAK